jgi:PqqD family protein of HPr-rel-A system
MAGPRYIADSSDEVRIVLLDGLSALYHAPSGMTHIVAPPAPEILAALQAGPADIAELVARLHERYDLEERADDIVALRLTELEQAGLVRRA